MTEVLPAEAKGCYRFIALTVKLHRLIPLQKIYIHLLLDFSVEYVSDISISTAIDHSSLSPNSASELKGPKK